MTARRSITILLMLMAGQLSAIASAAEPAREKADEWAHLAFHRSVRAGTTLENARTIMLRRFKAADLTGDGVSDADYKLQDQLSKANLRARFVSRWVGQDLDGDGEVTRLELEAFFERKARRPLRSSGVELTPTREQIAQTRNKLVGDALKDDKNGDEKITFSEAMASAGDKLLRTSSSRYRGQQAIPLYLDGNGDGIVTEQEFIDVVDRVLSAIDRDGDGKFSATEISEHAKYATELRRTARKERRARQADEKFRKIAAPCGFPKAQANAKVILLGVYEGLALSTVGLGGDDIPVSVANVWIEPGAEPLYIAIASYDAMVWRFTGAIKRIAHVVLSSKKSDGKGVPRVGIIGVPRDRVYIPGRTDCLQYFTGRASAEPATKLLRYHVGRSPDGVFARRKVSTVGLPSGLWERTAVYANSVKPPQSGPSARLWRQMLRTVPGGVVGIDASSIVSRSTAKPYTILPGEAGLAQLVEKGALRVIGTTTATTLGDTTIIGEVSVVAPEGVPREVFVITNEFLILKKITRFPVGLSRVPAVKFVLGRGVARPDHLPGNHIKLTDEATGKPVRPIFNRR